MILASELGVPIIATRRAAGFVDLQTAGFEIAPGDAHALAAALESIVTSMSSQQ